MLFADFVTETADGFDKGLFLWKRVVDAFSEVADIDLDGIGKDVGVVVPHMGNDLFFGEDLIRMPHQVLKERKFFGGKPDIRRTPFDGELLAVERQVLDGEDRIDCGFRSAAKRPYACKEFFEGKWLWEIIIGSHIETPDFIFCLASGSEDEDRSLDMFFPE